MTGPLCAAVSPHPEGGGDCLCLDDQHPDDQPHTCSTRGCGRQWAGVELGRRIASADTSRRYSLAEIENEFGGDAA